MLTSKLLQLLRTKMTDGRYFASIGNIVTSAHKHTLGSTIPRIDCPNALQFYEIRIQPAPSSICSLV